MRCTGQWLFLCAFLVMNIAASCDDPTESESPTASTIVPMSPETPRASVAEPAAVNSPAPASKLVRFTLKITADGVEVLSKVDAPGALNRRDPDRNSATVFRVVSGDSRVIFERGFQMPGERRGEFADSDGNLTRVQGPAEPPVISIVVPVDTTASKLQLIRRGHAADNGNPDGNSTAEKSPPPAEELIGEVQL